jgi:hypothetical protein
MATVAAMIDVAGRKRRRSALDNSSSSRPAAGKCWSHPASGKSSSDDKFESDDDHDSDDNADCEADADDDAEDKAGDNSDIDEDCEDDGGASDDKDDDAAGGDDDATGDGEFVVSETAPVRNFPSRRLLCEWSFVSARR